MGVSKTRKIKWLSGEGRCQYLLLNLRSPRDYVGSSVRPFVRSRLWYFLRPLDGASVREAHCEQASTAVREAHCEQASTAVRRTEAPCAQASTAVREAHCAQATGIYIKNCAFSDIWKIEMEIFFRDQQRIVYEIRLIAIRDVSPPFGEELRGLEQGISFPGNKHLLILRKCYAVHINASSL